GGVEAAGACEELMIIGGAAIYRAALPLAERMYLTVIQADVAGDARFVEFDSKVWLETARIDCEADEENPYPYSFITLQRRRPPDSAG
ncbi:MAG: dihydrofolate reductase, partial [Gammaproteobacteria bacterium]